MAYRLAKFDTNHMTWLDETLIPLQNADLYGVYQETKYSSVAQLEQDAEELYELALKLQEQEQASLAQG